MKPFKYRSLRNSAHNQECTMNVADVCSYNNETTVLAHINTDGGAMGAKTDDFSACFCCHECHQWLDLNQGSEIDRLHYTRRAMVRTWRVWFMNGDVTA